MAIPSRRFKFPLGAQILVALVLGALVGVGWPEFGSTLSLVGELYLQALRMLIIPLIFPVIVLALYQLGGSGRRLGRVASLTFGWFFLATSIAIVVALFLNALIRPGRGQDLDNTGVVPEAAKSTVNWHQFILSLIPKSVVESMAANAVLPTLVFAVLLGLALAMLGEENARPLVDLASSLRDAMLRIARWVIALTPLAVFGLISYTFATKGVAVVLGMAKLIGTLYLGLLISIVLFLLVAALLGQRPLTILRASVTPMLVGLSTRSSEVVFPVQMESLKKQGIPEKVASTVLPLGYSFNLDGSALYSGLAVMFLLDAYNVDITPALLGTVFATTLLATKGIANVPSGSLVAVTSVLVTLGLPPEALAIIIGVDIFMDMGRAAVNVYGNTIAVMVVNKFGFKEAAPDDHGRVRVRPPVPLEPTARENARGSA